MNATPKQHWWPALSSSAKWTFIAASGAWFFDCFDQQIFNLARGSAAAALVAKDLTPEDAKTQATFIGTASMATFLVGWGVGGLTLGSIGDRIGRMKTLAISILLYALFTGLSAFAVGGIDFCAYRFLTGIGVGGVFGLAVALIADTTSSDARPRALGTFQALSTVGNVGAGLTGLGLAALGTAGAITMPQWKVLFLVGALPALVFAVWIFCLKEPAAWVEARANHKGAGFGSYSTLLGDPKWRSRAWLALAVCSAGIIGLWGLGNFQPEVITPVAKAHYLELDPTLTKEALDGKVGAIKSWALMLQNGGGFVGMLLCAALCRTLGRRKALAASLVASACGAMLLFKGLTSFASIWWIIPLMGAACYAPFAVYAILLPELFPMRLRATGPSFAYNFGRFVAAAGVVGLFFLTKALKDSDASKTLENFRMAGFCMSFVPLLGLLAIPFLPETKDQPLPE